MIKLVVQSKNVVTYDLKELKNIWSLERTDQIIV